MTITTDRWGAPLTIAGSTGRVDEMLNGRDEIFEERDVYHRSLQVATRRADGGPGRGAS